MAAVSEKYFLIFYERTVINLRVYHRYRSSADLTGPPASLAEQLKQVLAERERRLGGNDMSSSRESSGDFSDLNNPHNNDPTLVTHHLVEEIRQAVNEANQRGKTC